MKLYAISDLHLANRINCQALEGIPAHPEDWIIVAGDVGEFGEHLKFALFLLTRRFKKVIWVPGNHDLWTIPVHPSRQQGEAKYRHLVSICRDYGVLTPEDPYAVYKGEDRDYLLVPMFLLYDYSFRPDNISEEDAVPWASGTGVICTDEELLHPSPYASRAEWCRRRIAYTEERLDKIPQDSSLIMINHFPLKHDMAKLMRYPAFSMWCGTRKTEDWHIKYPVSVVVYGHMHMRGTHYRDGIRFEEVSFGYPRDWNRSHSMNYYLRQILPHPK
ncbi:MAG: metallophosphoesterase [bacterium]|nr:metallophosphoesterase [bacterium]